MNETNDKFEKRLGEQLASHSVDVPADMWDRIAASMAEIDAAAKPATTPITIAPHRRQRLGLRRAWQYGIAAMLLLGIGLMVNRLVRIAPQPEQPVLLADATVLYDPATIAEPTPDTPDEVAELQMKEARKVESRLPSLRVAPEPAVEPSIEQIASSTTPESTNNHVPTESAANDNHKQSPKNDSRATTPQEQFEKRLQEVLAEQDRRRGGRLTTSLYASNVSRISNQTPSTARLAEAGMVKTEVLNSSHGEVIDKITAPPSSVRYQPETKLNHRVPFTVGVGVQYELTDRWAIESGATYTYLHSTGKAEGTFAYTTSQELHYVGVPLSASYKFVDHHRFELYARAGGAVERAVAAKRVQTVGTTDGNISNSTSQKINCKGVQLSATVGVGAELKLSQRVGIYAEAGAGYFFDNNQPLSYRTEHPLSLTLQAGARLHFGTK